MRAPHPDAVRSGERRSEGATVAPFLEVFAHGGNDGRDVGVGLFERRVKSVTRSLAIAAWHRYSEAATKSSSSAWSLRPEAVVGSS